MTLHLVRHGRPLPVEGVPARAWELDPQGFDDVWALRESGRLPSYAAWFCSPEPKAATKPAQTTTAAKPKPAQDSRPRPPQPVQQQRRPPPPFGDGGPFGWIR